MSKLNNPFIERRVSRSRSVDWTPVTRHLSRRQSRHSASQQSSSSHSGTLSTSGSEEEEESQSDEVKQDTLSEKKETEEKIDPRTLQKCEQIMFLYNSKSGGQKALSLLKYWRNYTDLTYDLLKLSSSETEMQKLSDDLQEYEGRLIVCVAGGDGSQCWAASLIDRAIQNKLLEIEMRHIAWPTYIPFPMGTGNDLSRSLGWGNKERKPNKIIKHIADALFCYNYTKRFSFLDRWSISYTFDETINVTEYLDSFSPPLPNTFLCYLSFGYDAKITHNFHLAREKKPKTFIASQKANQALYVKLGFHEMIRPSAKIAKRILLEVDGESVHIPSESKSLKLININSAASGTFFWGKQPSKVYKKPTLNDGLIEVVTTTGPINLVLVRSRLSVGHRLKQAKNIILKVVETPAYLQIDGEGWKIDKKCTLNIQFHDRLPTLIGYKKARGVCEKYTQKHHTRKVKRRRHKFRKTVKLQYGIPDSYSQKGSKKGSKKASRNQSKHSKKKTKTNTEKSRSRSLDDINIRIRSKSTKITQSSSAKKLRRKRKSTKHGSIRLYPLSGLPSLNNEENKRKSIKKVNVLLNN